MKKSFLLAALLLSTNAVAKDKSDTIKTEQESVRLVKVTGGLVYPFGMAFLPDGQLLITEKPGRLRLLSIEDKLSPPIKHVPYVTEGEQAGLLDVAVDPDFAENHFIYLSYSEADKEDRDLAGTAVARARLDGQSLRDVTVIFRQEPKVAGENHFGSRLVFDNTGALFVTLGERYDFEEHAQNNTDTLGKIVHIRTDGSIPQSNPYIDRDVVAREIWSLGHRNVQGAAIHPTTGRLWVAEHGPRGGDEINVPEAGRNYGWPEASYGSHYTMLPIPDDHKGRGYMEPIHHWNKTVAPSGLTFYTGDLFPNWKGDLFMGSLENTALYRLETDGEDITHQEKLFAANDERIRDVEQAPDGTLYMLTDEEDGTLYRIEPGDGVIDKPQPVSESPAKEESAPVAEAQPPRDVPADTLSLDEAEAPRSDADSDNEIKPDVKPASDSAGAVSEQPETPKPSLPDYY